MIDPILDRDRDLVAKLLLGQALVRALAVLQPRASTWGAGGRGLPRNLRARSRRKEERRDEGQCCRACQRNHKTLTDELNRTTTAGCQDVRLVFRWATERRPRWGIGP